MKITIRRLIFLLISILAFSLVFCACNKEEQDSEDKTEETFLLAPQNLRVEDKTLVWDPVKNATHYIVCFENERHTTKKCSYDLSELTREITYSIQIRAYDSGKTFTDSEWTLFSYRPKFTYEVGYTDDDFAYTLLEDGSGYSISKGNVDVVNEPALIIPSYYNGLPVKEIADIGFAISESVGPFTGKNCNSTTRVVYLPEKLEVIGARAFQGYTEIEEIDIPNTVTVLGERAFFGCLNLKKVNLSSTLKIISKRCFMCCGLTELSLPDTLEKIGDQAFKTHYKTEEGEKYSNQTFTKLVLPSSIKEIGYEAFSGCSKLKDIVLPSDLDLKYIHLSAFFETAWEKAQPNGVLYLGYILLRYKGPMPTDTEIRVPDTVKYTSPTAFHNQAYLKSIYIPDGVKFCGEAPRGYGLFSFCTSLSEVRLPSDLTEILPFTFTYCRGLTRIEIPDSVTVINESAFKQCSALEEIILPDKLEEIADGAFEGCKSLATVYYKGNADKWRNLIAQQPTDELLDATTYFYSETKPTESGNYWHYVDGKAVIWD